MECNYYVEKIGTGAGNIIAQSSTWFVEQCGENAVKDRDFCQKHLSEKFESKKWDECGLCGFMFSGDGCPRCFAPKRFCKGVYSKCKNEAEINSDYCADCYNVTEDLACEGELDEHWTPYQDNRDGEEYEDVPF
jgi:hypothetical protein